MATVKVKQVIPHPDGAIIVVPEDSSQKAFCIDNKRVKEMGGVKAGDVIEWDVHHQ
jgi:hypothetical protein